MSRFTVFAENGVSSMARGSPPKNADITVNTETTNNPSTIAVMFVKDVKPTAITVGWQAPADPYIEIEMYEVRYFVRGTDNNNNNVNNNNATLITIKEELEVTGLAEKTEYGFQVRFFGILKHFLQDFFENISSP